MRKLSAKRIFRKLYRLIYPKPATRIIYNSYSQAGEDAILSFLFTDKNITKITYLDVGSNMPDQCNNTYLFYLRGDRGVCVEADRTLIPLIQEKRPGDRILHAGVSVKEEKEADFFVFDVNGLNTFSKEESIKRELSGAFKIRTIEKVPLLHVNDIIKENFSPYPDLLSIDIEGLDLEVLKSLDFIQYPIPVICVETCMYSENHIRPKDLSIVEYIVSQGYEVYADTYINTIFVNKEWFYTN